MKNTKYYIVIVAIITIVVISLLTDKGSEAEKNNIYCEFANMPRYAR